MADPIVNALRDGLDRGDFLITIEYCLPPRGDSLKALHAIADYAATEPAVHAVALTDRVTSENDYEPLDVAAEVMQRSGKIPLIHISGKDRTPETIRERLQRCADAGLENVLVVTGDMPRPETPAQPPAADKGARSQSPPLNKGGQGGVEVCAKSPTEKKPPVQVIEPPNGFVDSVNGVHIAAGIRPPLLVASAITLLRGGVSGSTSPAWRMYQYIKMHKKIAHGARLIFNQVGYDLRKTQELPWYIRHAGEVLPDTPPLNKGGQGGVEVESAPANQSARTGIPTIAALYWLAPGFARFALAGNVPGVTFTESFCRRIEEICKEPDKGESRRTDMMALHIVLCKRFGYRGVHIGGLKKPESIARILRRVEELDTEENTAAKLWSKWCGHLRFNDGKPAELGQPNGYYVFSPDGHGLNSLDYAQANGESYFSPRYALLRAIHAVFFDRGLKPHGVGERTVRILSHIPLFKPLGYLVERAFKIPLVGCQGCGSCSLPDTEYVCIEGKCAKHLTNGPCGGQQDGKCEAYPDRECAWAEIYRRAKSRGNIAILMNHFVRPKDRSLKGTCSWVNLCLGLDHHGDERKPAGR